MVVVWISQFNPKLSAIWAIFNVPVTPSFQLTSARTMSAACCATLWATPAGGFCSGDRNIDGPAELCIFIKFEVTKRLLKPFIPKML